MQGVDAPEEAVALLHPWPSGSAPFGCTSQASGATGQREGQDPELLFHCSGRASELGNPVESLFSSRPLRALCLSSHGCHIQAPRAAMERERMCYQAGPLLCFDPISLGLGESRVYFKLYNLLSNSSWAGAGPSSCSVPSWIS